MLRSDVEHAAANLVFGRSIGSGMARTDVPGQVLCNPRVPFEREVPGRRQLVKEHAYQKVVATVANPNLALRA
jgi:hypothetical protein